MPAFEDSRLAFVFHKPAGDARSSAEKEFNALPMQARARLLQKMEKYTQGTSTPRDVKHIRDGIFEIRIQLGSNPYRVLFFMDGNRPVAVHCFHKKDQKVSAADMSVATQRRKTWVPGSASN
jgi:phage-related protein